MVNPKYEFSGSKVSYVSPNISLEDPDYNNAIEYCKHEVMAYEVSDEDCELIKVGDAKVLHFYPAILAEIEGSMYELFDTEQDTFDIYCALELNSQIKINANETIKDAFNWYTTMIIDRLEIYPQYSGQQLASKFVKNLVRNNYLKQNNLLVLINAQAYLIEDNNFDNETEYKKARLKEEKIFISLYKKLGFTRINDNSNVMYLTIGE